MSARSKLKNEMINAGKRAGGGFMTQQARRYFLGAFIRVLYELGFPLQSVSQLGVNAIVRFVEFQRAAGRAIRTLQNQMAMLRVILRNSGREQFSRDPLISNRALGIAGGSRIGTKTAFSSEEFESVLPTVHDKGLRAILQLEKSLGLRAMEAILSIRSLATWKRAILENRREIHVIFGTKGGRPRWVQIVDRDASLAAIELALEVIRERGRLAPKTNLKAAMKWYANMTHRLGIQGHRLRYTFTHCCIGARIAEGHTEEESFAVTSTSLGHGDARGRMVKSVYAHGVEIK